MSRSSSRGCRGDDRRDVSRSVGTSTTATASCASSSRRWVPSRVAVRRAERDRAAGRPHDEDRDVQGGQPLGHRLQAGDGHRGLVAPPEALVERGERRGASRFLAHVHVAGGQAHVGERVLDLRPAQHVHAEPGQVVVPLPGRPQQGGVQGTAAQRDIRGRACAARPPAGRRCRGPGWRTARRRCRGRAAAPCRRPPARCGKRRRPAAGPRRARWSTRCRPARVPPRPGRSAGGRRGHGRAGQHDPLDQIMGAHHPDGEFQRGLALPVGHAPVVTHPGHY